MTQIKEALLDFNPWWNENFTVEFKERQIYEKILHFMPTPQIIALTGLRRVGKTTLMLKIAEDFIKNGFGSENVLYFSFDEFRHAEIRELIKTYERLSEKNFRHGKYLLLLDEVQKLENWENQLKTVYDSFGKNVKIVISGSESLFLRRKSKETLSGRLFEFQIEPLNFEEFLNFKGANVKPVGFHEEEITRLFNEFIITMGFPELVNQKEKEIIKKYLNESILEKVIYRDIAILFNVKDASLIESLLNIFTEDPGQLVELSSLANELKISRQTLSNYLSYLENSFLIRKLYNFSKSKRKTERKLKKYYPTIISANLLFKEDKLSKSKVFECIIINQLNAEFFWRDPYKNEVDAVLTREVQKPIPIEIKYGKTDIKGLLAFMNKFDTNEGYIISPDKEEKQTINGKTVTTIPAFKFLLNRKKLTR